MLSYLQNWESFLGPLRLFQFISVRAILAGITALFVGFVMGPVIIRILRSWGAKQAFRDKDEVGELADLHQSKEKTPTMGGLIICISVLISSILWAEPNVYVVSSLVVFILLAGIGFADDFLKVTQKHSRGLPGKFKLLAQLATTLVEGF